MRNPAIGAVYALVMIVVVVGVDLLFFRGKTWFWERLASNVGIVLVFGAFYFRFPGSSRVVTGVTAASPVSLRRVNTRSGTLDPGPRQHATCGGFMSRCSWDTGAVKLSCAQCGCLVDSGEVVRRCGEPACCCKDLSDKAPQVGAEMTDDRTDRATQSD
jgi:hypothetical protein